MNLPFGIGEKFYSIHFLCIQNGVKDLFNMSGNLFSRHLPETGWTDSGYNRVVLSA